MIRDYGQAAIDLRRFMSLLKSQMEEKRILSGVSDKSSGVNELRQNQHKLYNIEEESRKQIPLNMYLILGVESTAVASEIKKAYRKAALKHHPYIYEFYVIICCMMHVEDYVNNIVF
ncbi:DnaJ domain-containing protein [Artemisia annua]|uniref:DnaJ domain-containing protein n=1 Tax=Artemisia annua TaxID=35608 RepID=A0A2U1PI13_ARTAN|nr:DnaJ domain-containing protein [Artemisia annua]